MTLTVTALYVYPIKSCRGISTPHVDVVPGGLKYDREWIVAGPDGTFFSQRSHPKLALVEPRFRGDLLEVTAPGMSMLRLSLANDTVSPTKDVIVHGQSCRGIEHDFWASDWFTQFLGEKCHLLRLPNRFLMSPMRVSASQKPIGFADGYETLLISWASLTDLNTRLETPVPMNRFRPNIVVSGCRPYEEDEWKGIMIGSIRLDGGTPCGRCVIIATDQFTGERHKEPLKTLSTYRRSVDGNVHFGRNLDAWNGGRIDLGSIVHVL